MTDARFFTSKGLLALNDIVTASGAVLVEEARSGIAFSDVAPLETAGVSDVSFFDNPKYLEQFKASQAGACFVRPKYAEHAPQGMALLLTEDPYRAYAKAAQLFYPPPVRAAGVHTAATVAASATIAATAHIAAGAVIGENVEIGEYVEIGANTVIEHGVIVGAHTRIGPVCSISHAIIGERCIIHRGVHIGQDGFGFALGRTHEKVPQLGRVVIHNDVEIGSGTTIDRGTAPDTIIHDGAKIDNLVQIGHNVQIGKGAIIISQTGISGSTRIGAGAILAGQSGLAGHLNVGVGARIAAKSGVMVDIPDGANYGGYPAMPVRDWHRQTVSLAKMIRKRGEND